MLANTPPKPPCNNDPAARAKYSQPRPCNPRHKNPCENFKNKKHIRRKKGHLFVRRATRDSRVRARARAKKCPLCTASSARAGWHKGIGKSSCGAESRRKHRARGKGTFFKEKPGRPRVYILGPCSTHRELLTPEEVAGAAAADRRVRVHTPLT